MQSILNQRAGRVSAAKVLAAVAVSVIVGSSAARASLVVPGSTFDVSILGINATGSMSVYDPTHDTFLVPTITATFGGTTTVGGVTVTSSETVVGQVITDKVSITTSTNFIPPGFTFNGQTIDTLVFDLGEDAEGGTQHGLNYVAPVNPLPAYFTSGGTATYSALGGGTPVLAAGTDFNVGNTSLYATEGVFQIPTLADLSPYDYTNFTYTAVQVPEPVSIGLIGMAGLGLLRRRRKFEGHA